MSGNPSIEISAILGPVLMIMALSEYFNFKIWKSVDPTVVYLNGLLLLIAGLLIIRYHWLWIFSWTILVTLSGWLIFIIGAYRMFFPTKMQVTKNNTANIIFLILFLLGLFLSSKSYFL